MPSAPDTNKQTVLAFYDALVNKKDFNLARTFALPAPRVPPTSANRNGMFGKMHEHAT